MCNHRSISSRLLYRYIRLGQIKNCAVKVSDEDRKLYVSIRFVPKRICWSRRCYWVDYSIHKGIELSCLDAFIIGVRSDR